MCLCVHQSSPDHPDGRTRLERLPGHKFVRVKGDQQFPGTEISQRLIVVETVSLLLGPRSIAQFADRNGGGGVFRLARVARRQRYVALRRRTKIDVIDWRPGGRRCDSLYRGFGWSGRRDSVSDAGAGRRARKCSLCGNQEQQGVLLERNIAVVRCQDGTVLRPGSNTQLQSPDAVNIAHLHAGDKREQIDL